MDHAQLASRDELTKRIIPQMKLGEANSLPIPLAQDSDSSLASRNRFSVFGTAIITGGMGTLAMTAANALLQHGLDNLMLLDINPDVFQLTAMKNRFPLAKIEARHVDITDEVAVQHAIDEAAILFGSVDMLLCFAGIVACAHALDISPKEWRKVLDINTTGSFLCAQAVARQMVKQGKGGSITFIASISAHRVNFPQPQVSYNVSKAALLTLRNCLAAEWARYGIRTNTISPGYMDTILNEGDGLAAVRQIWADRNPSGRMGDPSELTGAVVLLCSSAGSYINGADIVVDGGSIVF
jgi:sorbose reductase